MRHITYILLLILFVVACNSDGKKYLRDVYFDYHSSKMAIPDTMLITLMFYPEHTNAGVPDIPIIWTSSDTNIIRIEPSGEYSAKLIANNIGAATIKATLGDFVASTLITVDYTNAISDGHFLNLCLAYFDTNNDGVLQGTEIVNVIGIDASELASTNDPISFEGIELFSSLQTFKATHLIISDLDLSKNTNLTTIDISESEIASLDLSNNLEIQFLDCHACSSLSDIKFATPTSDKKNQMRIINCQRCSLTQLDVSKCILLEYLDCSQNQLTTLDLSNNVLLKQLDCTGNNITSITLWDEADTEEFKTDSGTSFTY